MPKNIKQAPKTTSRSNSQDIKSLIKQNEFAIGAGTIIALAVFTFFAVNGFFSKLNPSKPTPIQGTSSTSSANLMPTPQIDTSTKSGWVKEIKQLSNTSSVDFVTVRNGDSYARIAKRYCGNGRIYMFISEMNGNADLHPGDTIRVSCDF